ncbi:MAG: hypothetical protein OEZ01_09465 [Candidatus Heimdallarchaeota archaeon]|nr:hypothetical protein [Candidatus Heimdallarchaeota archaeon]MDH5646224.1 hypothetical protein [Candidatus Heimdallarchaeota archaeon]
MEDKDNTIQENTREEILLKEFEHNFFKTPDLRAAAGIGLYFRISSFQQEKVLKTRTLIKDTRVWFKEFNRLNLLQIFAECNRLQFIMSEKDRKSYIPMKNLRKLIEDEVKLDVWSASPEERSLAFMIGYDSFVSKKSNTPDDEVIENDE